MSIEQYRATADGKIHLGELTSTPGSVKTLCGLTIRGKRQQLRAEVICPDCQKAASDGVDVAGVDA